jgi:FAD/FMN-containing dehydrogenase
MRLPPGVKSKDFSDALKQFAEAVGKKWVFTSDEDVDLYRDSYSPFWHEAEDPVPSAAVAPDGVEQVQAVVKIANDYKIPIWTISTGKNLGYGGAAPLLSGSVVLDLKRMDRVLEVNDKNHYALVEPGVSYFDLYRYIQERKLKVWIDVPDPGWGSPIGNSLDRGGGYTPMRDHFDAHCGMEVVLANGDILRTGMGALPGSKTWQQYRYGFGPYVDGMFSQGNFGVVTKMGFWLFPEPEGYRSGTVLVHKHDDLIPLVETISYLLNSNIAQGTTTLGSPLLTWRASRAGGGLGGAALLTTPGSPSIDELEKIGRERNLAYWGCELHFYGPPKVVDAQWEHAKDKFSAIPGATFQEGQSFRLPLAEKDVESAPKRQFGIPSLTIFGTMGRTEGHMWFSPIIPMTGEAVFEAQRVFGQAFADMGVPSIEQFFVFPSSFFPRSFVILCGFPITHNVGKNRKNREIFKRLVHVAAEHGWGEYRTHIAFMDTVANVYSFNNHALRRFHETVKDAVDPNGILSPGRCGVWPKHLRKERA